MGRNLQVEWQESAEELKQQYRAENRAQRRERLFTLWHLRLGKQIRQMAEITGTDERIIQRWVSKWWLGRSLETGHRSSHDWSPGLP